MLTSSTIWLVVNIVWLLFLSDRLSRFAFRDDVPLARALKCVAVSYLITWVLDFTMVVWSPLGKIYFRTDLVSILPGLAAAVIVFLWEWRSFTRHWTRDEDHEETFG